MQIMLSCWRRYSPQFTRKQIKGIGKFVTHINIILNERLRRMSNLEQGLDKKNIPAAMIPYLGDFEKLKMLNNTSKDPVGCKTPPKQ